MSTDTQEPTDEFQWYEPQSEDEPQPEDEVQPADDLPQDELEPTPRTVDVAAWVARGIVVLTIALVTIVGGLLLGMSVTDTTSTATPTPTTSTSSGAPTTEVPTQEATFVRGPTAPAVRISAPAPDVAPSAQRTASPVRTVQATATRAPTVATSPTATSTPRGKSTNTAKPKPTKTN
jgi:hypothetical protein